jgi:hypothetical protein
MLRWLCAALGAVMLVATLALAPAAAAERATLKVTARVVERCTVGVPSWVPPGLWRARQRAPWRFVRHECGGKPPFWVHAEKVWFEWLRDRYREHASDRGGRRHEQPHPTRHDVVLITVTY